ncbi:hypothetical protein HK102_007468, partial [Quaeritorhiza haematococci]
MIPFPEQGRHVIRPELEKKVVECGWDGSGWVVHRVRQDKDRPNHVSVATNVWKSIAEPVLIDDLVHRYCQRTGFLNRGMPLEKTTFSILRCDDVGVFFESDAWFQFLLRNLESAVVERGMFLGSCMDAMIHAMSPASRVNGIGMDLQDLQDQVFGVPFGSTYLVLFDFLVIKLETIGFTLESKDSIEQRSVQWFGARSGCLTASDIATVLTMCPKAMDPYLREFGIQDFKYNPAKCANVYTSAYELLSRKCHVTKGFEGNEATRFGQMMEQVSVNVYQQLTSTQVLDLGLMIHEHHPFLGASPDGVTVDGKLLEIKNPLMRAVSSIPPYHYWAQCQLQLAVCNLEVCDFFDCEFVEYVDKATFMADATTGFGPGSGPGSEEDCEPEDSGPGSEEDSPPEDSGPGPDSGPGSGPGSEEDSPPEDSGSGSEEDCNPPEDSGPGSEAESEPEAPQFHRFGLFIQDLTEETFVYADPSVWTLEEFEAFEQDTNRQRPDHTLVTRYYYLKDFRHVPIRRSQEWFDNCLGDFREFWERVVYYREHPSEFPSEPVKKRRQVSVKPKKEHLQSLAQIINQLNPERPHIKITAPKRKLWQDIQEYFRPQCHGNEVCWVDKANPVLDYLQRSNQETWKEIMYHTFKPKLESEKFNSWLSTNDINHIMTQITAKHAKTFTYIGCFPSDYFVSLRPFPVSKLRKHNRAAIIFNLDASWEPGSHWVCCFFEDGVVEYFDPLGMPPNPNLHTFLSGLRTHKTVRQ